MTKENHLQLEGKSVLISGADSGIGKAVALLFAKEGADIAIIYHSDDKDAEKTKKEIEQLGRKVILFSGDVNNFQFCKVSVNKTISEFGKLDILINNAGVQFPADDILDLEEENIRTTFNANIIGMILLTKAAFPHLKQGDSVINTTSATAYQGHKELLDYSATKGAIVSFTRSLALQSKPKEFVLMLLRRVRLRHRLPKKPLARKRKIRINHHLKETQHLKKWLQAFFFSQLMLHLRLPGRSCIRTVD